MPMPPAQAKAQYGSGPSGSPRASWVARHRPRMSSERWSRRPPRVGTGWRRVCRRTNERADAAINPVPNATVQGSRRAGPDEGSEAVEAALECRLERRIVASRLILEPQPERVEPGRRDRPIELQVDPPDEPI